MLALLPEVEVHSGAAVYSHLATFLSIYLFFF